MGALCGYPKEYNTFNEVPLKENKDGIEIKRLKYIQLNRNNFIGRLINYFSFVFSVLLKLYEIASYKVVVVYSNPPILPLLSIWAKKLFKTKVIFVSYDLYPEIAVNTNETSKSGILVKIMEYINKRVFKNVDYVVALSNEMKKFIINNREIESKKINVIPNWHEDLGEPKKSGENNFFYDQYKNKLVVSYFGNMGTCQDIDTILNTIRLLKMIEGVHFLFAGHGNKMKILKDTIYKEKLKNVDVYDFLHGNHYEDALSISSISIISLYKNITGLCVPSKTYSYMQAGIPIIAIMDHSDIVEDINQNNLGIAVENGESEKLAEYILKLKYNPELIIQMGKNSRKVFLEKYTKEKNTEKYISLIEKIIEE